MKKYGYFVLVITVVLMTGCESMGDKTKKGAGIGAVTGAAIGGIVGHQSGKGWQGAGIGAAAGAVAGGLLGNQMDKKDEKKQTFDRVSGDSMTVSDVIQMSRDGVPDDVIMGEIDRTESAFSLSSKDITYLKDNGVSDTVIDHMLARR